MRQSELIGNYERWQKWPPANYPVFPECWLTSKSTDNPTEITRQDIDLVIRSLRNTNAMPFITGIEGENKFGSAPRIACGGIKSLVIDLELLAA